MGRAHYQRMKQLLKQTRHGISKPATRSGRTWQLILGLLVWVAVMMAVRSQVQLVCTGTTDGTDHRDGSETAVGSWVDSDLVSEVF